jgi:hypothetical protein
MMKSLTRCRKRGGKGRGESFSLSGVARRSLDASSAKQASLGDAPGPSLAVFEVAGWARAGEDAQKGGGRRGREALADPLPFSSSS